jgi:hypothetical protein
MAQPMPYLTSVSRYRRPGGSSRQRVLAALLAAMLALGGLLPGAAYAGEADSEGEGSAPPESVTEPGEEPEFDPGGEDTALEGLPAVAGAPGGDAEDTGEGEPVEAEPELDTEAPPPPAEPAGAVPEAVATDEEPAPPQAPVEAPAETESESAPAPGYETTSPPPSTPIENRPLVAPPAPPQDEPEASEEPVPAVVSTGPPPAPPSSEQTPAPRPVATTIDRDGGGRSLADRDSHTVRPGECLWSIAEALLPAGAGNREITQEVQRLWQLNASRIGTGDPNMLPVGVELRLR